MGKKQDRPTNNGVHAPPMPQKELYQRVNFAIQASTYLQSLGISTKGSSSDRKGKRKACDLPDSSDTYDQSLDGGSEGLDYQALAKGGMKATRKMVAHTQLKLDPSLKRNMCRECGTYLIPGLTCRIRNRPNGRTINVINTTCLDCSASISIPAPPTSLGDPSLDGPRRRRRREKVASRSKVAFHEREKSGHEGKGHVLWSSDQRIDGWGHATAEAPPSAIMTTGDEPEDVDEDDEEAQFSMA